MAHRHRPTYLAAALLLALIGPRSAGARSAGAADDTAAADAGKVKLEVGKPKRAYERRPIHVPKEILVRLDKPWAEPPPLMVPKGTRLLSRGRPVTSGQSKFLRGSLDLVTDGDKEAADERFVDLGPGVQWVQIDLGRPAAVHAVAVWHDHREMWIYRDVVVRVSNDADFAAGVTTLYNNDDGGGSELGVGSDNLYVESHHGKVIDAKGVKARYVRLYSDGNSAEDVNHYTEVEVYGIIEE